LEKGTYEGAYDQGFGRGGYNALYESKIGSGEYKSVPVPITYKNQFLGNTPGAPVMIKKKKTPAEEFEDEEKPMEEEIQSSSVNTQFKSYGFPNTLPEGMMTSPLFRKQQPVSPQQQTPVIQGEPQQPVVPMVRQPYQPRVPMPTNPQMTFMGSNPYRNATPQGRFVQQQIISPGAPRRTIAPFMSGPMPKMGGSMGTNVPQILRPNAPMTTMRAPQSPQIMRAPSVSSPITFFGVPMRKNNSAPAAPAKSPLFPSIGEATMFGIPIKKRKTI
jgi:hypothetical protein